MCTADDGTIAAETPERSAALSVYIVVALVLSAVAVSIVQKRRTRALRRLRDRERSVNCVSVAGLQQQSADHQSWTADSLLAGGGGAAVGLGGILPSGGPSALPGAGALASPPPPQQRPPRPAGGGLHGKGAGVTGLLLPYQGACFWRRPRKGVFEAKLRCVPNPRIRIAADAMRLVGSSPRGGLGIGGASPGPASADLELAPTDSALWDRGDGASWGGGGAAGGSVAAAQAGGRYGGASKEKIG